MSQHMAIDAEDRIPHFVALSLDLSRVIGLFADSFQVRQHLTRQRIRGHVTPFGEGRTKFLERQKYLTIVSALIAFRFDVDRSNLPRICAPVQVVAGNDMRVIKSKAARFGHERNSARAMRRDKGRPFFRGPIYITWNLLTVPVQQFGRIGFIEDIHRDALTLLEPKKRPWKLPIVESCGDDLIRR